MYYKRQALGNLGTLAIFDENKAAALGILDFGTGGLISHDGRLRWTAARAYEIKGTAGEWFPLSQPQRQTGFVRAAILIPQYSYVDDGHTAERFAYFQSGLKISLAMLNSVFPTRSRWQVFTDTMKNGLPIVIGVVAAGAAGAALIGPAAASGGAAAGSVAASGAATGAVAAGGAVLAPVATGATLAPFAVTGTLLETVAVTGAAAGIGAGAALAIGAAGIGAAVAVNAVLPSSISAPSLPSNLLPQNFPPAQLEEITVAASHIGAPVSAAQIASGAVPFITQDAFAGEFSGQSTAKNPYEPGPQKPLNEQLLEFAKKQAIDYGTDYAMQEAMRYYAEKMQRKMTAAEEQRLRDELDAARAEYARLIAGGATPDQAASQAARNSATVAAVLIGAALIAALMLARKKRR